jgi:Phospholipase_D-nuclease N-terminal
MPILFLVIWGLLILAASIFWAWMLVDVLTNRRLYGTDKLVWVVMVIFLSYLGAALYFMIGREQRVA